MDANTRSALKAELDAAVKERERLDVVIGYISDRLGIPAPTGSGTDSGETQPPVNLQGAPADAVNAGQFFNTSAPKAARQVLEIFGKDRPLKTDELYEAVIKGGVQIKSAGVLYRSLVRDDAFYKVGRSLWGLSEWYPGAKRGKAEQNGDEPDEAELGDEPDSADEGGAPTASVDSEGGDGG